MSASAAPSSNERALPFLLYTAVFVVVLLLAVWLRGGSSFFGRVQRFDALWISIQSEDPARELLDDREKDIALIEGLLSPAPDRHERAVAYYELWRSNKEWKVYLDKPALIDLETRAKVTRPIRLEKDGIVRAFSYDAEWEKLDGVWYQKSEKQVFRQERDAPPNGPVLP